jgi:hypothetical protein
MIPVPYGLPYNYLDFSRFWDDLQLTICRALSPTHVYHFKVSFGVKELTFTIWLGLRLAAAAYQVVDIVVNLALYFCNSKVASLRNCNRK